MHSVIRWCFERQPRWAPEKAQEASVAASWAASNKGAARPPPYHTLTSPGPQDSFVRGPTRGISDGMASALPQPCLPNLPAPASTAPAPRWMLTPALLDLDSDALLTAYEPHFHAQGCLLTQPVMQPLGPEFFVVTGALGSLKASQALFAALWGAGPQPLQLFAGLAFCRPETLNRQVARAATQAGLALEPPAIQRIVQLLQLNGLEAHRREIHQQLVAQAQRWAYSVSTCFDDAARARAAQTLAVTAGNLEAYAASFIAAPDVARDAALPRAFAPDGALDEFNKLLDQFAYYLWRERIVPADRTERVERTSYTFHAPTVAYGDHARDTLLDACSVQPPAALLPPSYAPQGSQASALPG